MPAKQQLAEKEQKQQLARLTAAVHQTQNHFLEHEAVEGYFEDRSAADFYGCDRLLKLENMYGRVQMGYDPKRGQSFLMANVKTSVYDTAASAHQRRVVQADWRKALKSGTQNVAYSARRRAASATLLYKAENKPWNENSIRHYLAVVDLETLRRTMPFLDRQQENQRRKELDQLRHSRAEETEKARQKGEDALRTARAGQVAEETESDRINEILAKKQAQSRWFFRRINLVFDLQKQKMFDHYRAERAKRALEAEQTAAPPADDKKDQDGKR